MKKKKNTTDLEPKIEKFWDVKFKEDNYASQHAWDSLTEEKRISWILEQIDLMKYRILVFEKAIAMIKVPTIVKEELKVVE